jgi:hypothetical protein
LPIVDGSLWVLRLLPPLKLVAMNDIAEILLKVMLIISCSSIIYLYKATPAMLKWTYKRGDLSREVQFNSTYKTTPSAM